MAVIYTKGGNFEVVPTNKKTYQGSSGNTKYCQRGSRPRRKRYRGQGK